MSNVNCLLSWVNDFKVIVFSMDYRVAPENKYPNLIDENLRAYEKIVTKCKEMFGFRIKKLVLTGDSGGGLMCLNIVKHALRYNLRVPDGLVLLYPCNVSLIRFEDTFGKFFAVSTYVYQRQLYRPYNSFKSPENST